MNTTKQAIDCDAVWMLKEVLIRYGNIVRESKPKVSRIEDAALTAGLLEIMEILKLTFADRKARHNAISHFGELYPSTDESPA